MPGPVSPSVFRSIVKRYVEQIRESHRARYTGGSPEQRAAYEAAHREYAEAVRLMEEDKLQRQGAMAKKLEEDPDVP